MPTRQLELSWQYDLREERARVLALMFAAGGALCLFFVISVDRPGARYPLFTALGCGAVVLGILLWTTGRRFPPWLMQSLLALFSLLVGLLAAASITTAGVVGLGPAVIIAAMYAGYFLTRRSVVLQTVLAVLAYAGGALLSSARPEAVHLLSVALASTAVAATLNRLTRRLRRRSTLDALTGAVSRATWLQMAEREIGRQARPVCVAIIDLDNFKAVNDEDGHLAGDALLRELSELWTSTLGRQAVVGRYGGDEFVLLMSGLDLDEARARLDTLARAHPAEWTAGIAQARPGELITDLLTRADAELLDRKRELRSRQPD
ncbi:diguanylate cyclase [Nakamurella sp. YIM 132087]|uniref:Diguanylate cyclase n=1 Tax=Nakamurella alba TaxID=2665158 RepID=A0A7K1FLA8_9ACTN|nr:GGDEF domain-containing protein [Nakamurella alba]MTD14932.1 diguanylate cyclase [Nakamurella alba]